MGIPVSAYTPETRMGIGITTTSRYLARSNAVKATLAFALCFALVHWCFDVEKFKEQALRFVSSGHPRKHEEATTIEQNNVSSQTPQQTAAKMHIPEDVLSDGRRANQSVQNLCPLIPPNLVGYIPVKTDVTSLEAVEDEFPDVMEGGHFRPKECTSRHRVAILVPYRDRAAHLPVFIYNLHRVLSRQQIDYGIFVIEQADKLGFNRAKLLNVGFVESTALYDYQCFVFHDVDLVPLDDRNIYTCPEQPRHMSIMRNDTSIMRVAKCQKVLHNKESMHYLKSCLQLYGRVFYKLFFGGVSAVNKEHMLLVNGYSNVYWGWGAEDDDMAYRLNRAHLKIVRRSSEIGRYFGLGHVKSKPSEKRMQLLNSWRSRAEKDGLNSLKYKRLDIVFKKLYTWVLVDLSEKQ